ncbi:hypothetical protein [Herbaspirillum sp.]|uniref:hypothetical protein n=1 Tax=Herbaspirillum sp. TaxID=1890675 RepID=UPI001B2C560A|nr:hypothetical protein [Herbaspirillum sp.]MBO9536043.1 hypothetical protein [Herbaspirillum sp.]
MKIALFHIPAKERILSIAACSGSFSFWCGAIKNAAITVHLEAFCCYFWCIYRYFVFESIFSLLANEM